MFWCVSADLFMVFAIQKEGQNWSILKGKGAVYSPDVINCCLGPIRSLRN